MSLTNDLVARAVGGDLDATRAVVDWPRAELIELMRHAQPLTVTRVAAASVVQAAAPGPSRSADAASWSRLVRTGLTAPGSRDFFCIEYEPACEDAIAEIVLRLDDLPEQPLSAEEADTLIASLGEHRPLG